MKRSPSIGVVVRALNEEQHIGRLLTGLKHQTVLPQRVILVDSGSRDATVSIAESLGAEISHIRPEEFTFGRSLNVGIEACDTDVVLNLSAHVYPLFDSFVERMTAPFSDEEVAITYGRQVGDHRTHFSESRVMQRWYPSVGSGRQDHAFSNNANACVRRNVWDSLRYDEELTGLEDIEFAARAQAKGWQVHYVAEAPVSHVHEESYGQIQNRYRREAMAYARIHPGWRLGAAEAVLAAGVNALSDSTQAMIDRYPPKVLPSIWSFRAAQFLGAWQGSSSGQVLTENLRKRMFYPASIRPSELQLPVVGNVIDYAAEIESQHVD